MKMRILSTLMVLPVLVLCGCGDEGGGGPGDEKIRTQVEGQWVPVEGTSNGEAPPRGYLDGMVFEFKDAKFRLNDSMWMDYTIDTSRTPARIDIKNSLKQVGIVKMEDGKLHLCTGVGGDRPEEFKTAPGTDRTYLVMKRKEQAARETLPVELKAGAVYALKTEDGKFSIMKVLVVEGAAVHVCYYRDKFDRVPDGIATKDLQALIDHAPLSREGFMKGDRHLIATEQVSADELEGYRLYLKAIKGAGP